MKELLENLISQFDFTQLTNILAGVFAFLVAYIKILPQIPRSSTKILSDIDLYEKSKNSEIVNSEIIKKAIEREVQRKYRPPTKIYSYSTFFISLSILITIGYFAYDKIIEKQFDTTFFFLSLVSFGALVGLIASFDEPVIDNKDKNSIVVRKPVFSFQIFSWGELFGGSITSLIFGFWTYNRFFENGVFEFDWWGLLTLMFFFTGIGIITGAFKKEKEIETKK